MSERSVVKFALCLSRDGSRSSRLNDVDVVAMIKVEDVVVDVMCDDGWKTCLKPRDGFQNIHHWERNQILPLQRAP